MDFSTKAFKATKSNILALNTYGYWLHSKAEQPDDMDWVLEEYQYLIVEDSTDWFYASNVDENLQVLDVLPPIKTFTRRKLSMEASNEV